MIILFKKAYFNIIKFQCCKITKPDQHLYQKCFKCQLIHFLDEQKDVITKLGTLTELLTLK